MLGLKLNHVRKRGHCYDQHRKIGKKPLSAEQNSKHNNISKPIYRGDHKLGIQSLLWLRSLRAANLQNITQNNTCWIHRWIRRIHIYKRSIGNLSYIYDSQWLTFQWYQHFYNLQALQTRLAFVSKQSLIYKAARFSLILINEVYGESGKLYLTSEIMILISLSVEIGSKTLSLIWKHHIA